MGLVEIGLDIEFKLVKEIIENLNTQTDADTYYIIIGKILFFKNLHPTGDGYIRLLFLINSINGPMTKEKTNKTHLIYLLIDHFFNIYNLNKPQQCKIGGGGKNIVSRFLKALLFTIGYIGANNLIVQKLTSPMFINNARVKNNTNTQYDLNCISNDVGFCFLLAESQTVPPQELSGVFSAFSDNSDTFINSAKHSTKLQNMVSIPRQSIVNIFGYEEDSFPNRANYMDGRFIGPLSTRQTSFVNRVFDGIANRSTVKYIHYEQVNEINDKYECIKLYNADTNTSRIIQHNFLTLMAEKHIINAINSAKSNEVEYKIGDYVTFSIAFSDKTFGHGVIGVGVEVYTDEGNTKVLYCIIESNMLNFMKAYESHRGFNFSNRIIGNDSAFTCSVGFFSKNELANFQKGMVKEAENPIGTVLTGYNKLNATLFVVIPKPITSPRQSVLPIYSEEFNKGVYDKVKFREEIDKMFAKRMVVKRLLERGEEEKRVIKEIAKKLASADSEINRLAESTSKIKSLDGIVDDTLNDIMLVLSENAKNLSHLTTNGGMGFKTTKKRRNVKKVKKGTRLKKNKK